MRLEKNPIIVPEEPEADTIRVPVVKVVDGDGFLTKLTHHRHNLDFEVSVRFGFIDAPEMDQRGGIEARDFLNSLIGGRHVDLSVLYKSDTGKIVDRHNRIVCVPYLTAALPPENVAQTSLFRSLISGFWDRKFLTRNIELEMVANGWAWVLERYGPDERYLDALSDAQRHRRGIWAMEDNIPPWQFKYLKYKQNRMKSKPSRQPNFFSVPPIRIACPQEDCGGHLVQRNGRYGAFLGCSNFPKCKYSRAQ